LTGGSLYYNGNVYCDDGSYSYFSVPAGECVTDDGGFSFGDVADIEMMGDLESIRFVLSVQTRSGDRTIIYDQFISVMLTEDTTHIPTVDFFSEGYYKYDTATRGILATEQTIAEKDGLAVNLVGFGGNGDENGKFVAVFRFENNDDKKRHVNVSGFVFDGIYVEGPSGPIEVPAGCVMYKAMVISEKDLDEFMITSPKSLVIDVRFMAFATLEGGGGFSEQVWCPVKLDEAGTGSEFVEGEDVIFEDKGIRIALKSLKLPEEDGLFTDTFDWICTVVNDGGKDISVEMENILVNGKAVDETEILGGAFASSAHCGDGQSTVITVYCYDEYGDEVEVTFDLVFYDIISETLLWRGNKSITLTGEK